MKTFGKTLIVAALAVLISSLSASVNAQVVVTIQQPPPRQLNVEDLWSIDATNNTQETFTVYLRGTATEERDGLIFEGSSNTFSLPPGFRRVNLANMTIDVKYSNKKYEDIVLRTGSVSEGDYTVCIYVINADNGEELGRGCIQQHVAHPSPPPLISPKDGATVEDEFPVFSWMPPMPLLTDQIVSYNLKIVEILSGQTPIDAMQSNPAWFEEEGIPSTSLRYPVGARAFEYGKNYCWQVQALIDNYPINQSEIWTFVYQARRQMITREKATKIIMEKVIKPKSLDHDILAFLGRQPLQPGDQVREDAEKAEVMKIEEPTWFAWINDDPQAEFAHTTRYVFINAMNGELKVLERDWWPCVNNQLVWQTREELKGDHYVIFSTIDEQ